jgi:benzoylformate decarboxylase
VTFVILNNGCYEALRDFALHFGFGKDDVVQGTALPDLDFVGLAKAMGCHGVRVDNAAVLAKVLNEALSENRPNLVEVTVA